MEAIAVIVALGLSVIMLAMPVVSVVLGLMTWSRMSRMRARVENLEDELARLRGQGVPVRGPDAVSATRPAEAESAVRPSVPSVEPGRQETDPVSGAGRVPEEVATGRPERPSPPPTRSAPRGTSLAARARMQPEKVVVWVASALGGLALLLMSLFALSAAIERGWLGPVPRVAGGLVLGTGLWVGGSFARPRGYRWVASALSGAGMGMLFGVLFSAHSLYDLLDTTPAFVLLVAVSAVAVLTAVRHDDRFMAWLGLVGGLLTPVLLSTGSNRAVALFTYLGLLTSGMLVAAVRRRWTDLVVGSAAGVGTLFVGWTLTYHLTDQVPVAVVSACALGVPFAVAGWRSDHTGVRVASWLAALGTAALLLPWVVPVDPEFVDPMNGSVVLRDLGSAPAWAALGVSIGPAGALVVARRREWTRAGLAALAVWAVLGLVGTWSWARRGEPEALALHGLLLGPMVVSALVVARSKRLAAGWALPLLGMGMGASVLLRRGVGSADTLGLAVVCAVGVGLTTAWMAGEGALVLAVLGAVAFALVEGANQIDAIGVLGVAGPSLLAYAVLATAPLLVGWPRRETVAHGASALAAPVVFWPLYRVWEQGLGDPMIGVLPALLGAGALLGGATLVRRHRASAGSGSLALMLAVALAGFTAALPLQLEDAWLTVAWALEAAALAWLGRRLRHPLVPVGSVLLAAAVTARLCLNPWALAYGDTSGTILLNWTLYTWGVPMAALLVGARGIAVGEGVARLRRHAPAGLVLMAVGIGFALVNVQVSHAFQDAGPVELGGSGLMQGMVRSLGWAAYGVTVLVTGLRREGPALRLVGFAIVLAAAGKVFAVDLWSLSGFVRVGSLLGLGVSLLLAAFLFERLVLRRDADGAGADESGPADPDSTPGGA